MNMACAAKQGLNDTVNIECFCSCISDIVMIRNKVQNINKRHFSHRQREQCWKINESIDLLSGEFVIEIRMDTVGLGWEDVAGYSVHKAKWYQEWHVSKWHSKVFTRLQINETYEQSMMVERLRGEL